MNIAYKESPTSTFDGQNFAEKLNLKAKVINQNDNSEVCSTQIEDIKLTLYPYGFEGKIKISGYDDDELYKIINAPDIMQLELSFFSKDVNQSDDPLLEIKSIATPTDIQSLSNDDEQAEHVFHLYELTFCDYARAIWQEHYPTNIYVDKTMKDIIDEHLHADIKLEYAWDELEKQHPIIAFSLEEKSDRPSCHFYSFLHWYLHKNNGLLLYDYKENTYKITTEKPTEKPNEIHEKWVAPPQCHLPKYKRYTPVKLTHNPETFVTEPEETENAFSTIRRDYIDRKDYHLYPEHDFGSSLSEPTPTKNSFECQVTQLRDDSFEFHIDKLIPGTIVQFTQADSLKGTWSKDNLYKEKTFRITQLSFEAEKIGGLKIVKHPEDNFSINLLFKTEDPEETYTARPFFIPPTYPFPMHGKIFSEIGDEDQTTYQLEKDEEITPYSHYSVIVPIAGEEVKVIAPFFPYTQTGQHYYPLCKKQQVLIDTHLHTAKIGKILDYQPLTRLPDGIQGNRVVYASNGPDISVIQELLWQDDKDPIYTIEHSSSEDQKQTIRIQDKKMSGSVVDKDKRHIEWTLDRDEGISWVLKDEESGAIQEKHFDGKQITHTCTDGSDTSQSTQTASTFSFTCKTFCIKADDVKIDAKKEISQKAGSSIKIDSKEINLKAPSIKQG